MAITFKLQVFEGPLDLLLHLIDMNKIDIYDIPIAMITDQYLQYIETMQVEDMELTSDFLVMAATLLRIKSQMMLPVEVKEAEEKNEDPRSELVAQLLEYKMYKHIAKELDERAFDASQSFFRIKKIPEDLVYEPEIIDLDALVGDMDIQKLYTIFQSVMKKQFDKIDPIRSQYGKIEQEPVNVIETVEEIVLQLKHQEEISFRRMIRKRSSKEKVVVTFLAVLEMIKNGIIIIKQTELFDDIFIYRGEEFGKELIETGGLTEWN